MIMIRYKYTAMTLTDALSKLLSDDEEKSKEGLKFLSMASRCELFGKTGNTTSNLSTLFRDCQFIGRYSLKLNYYCYICGLIVQT